MLNNLTSWSLRHRVTVVALWVVALLAATAAATVWGGEPKQEFLSPGTESKAAVELLTARFPEQAGDSVTIVLHDPADVLSPRVRSVAEPLVERFRALPHVVGVVAPWDEAGAMQVSPDGQTAYAVAQLDTTGAAFPTDVATEMVDQAADARDAGVQVELSGQAVENVQSSSMGAEGPGLAIAALVLLLAFGSVVAAGLPLATALFGVGTGLAAGRLLSSALAVPEWASSVAIMIGLGVGIDYALLILTRYRSEITGGSTPRTAVMTAMATAGRSVVFAGITVVISLLGMLTMNQPYVPGVVFSAVLTVATVLLAALTLLPALIGVAGKNVDRLRVPFLARGESPGRPGFWSSWSRATRRHPVLTGAAALGILAVLIAPVTELALGYPDDGNDPASLTTRRAYDLMTHGFGPGVAATFLLVADGGDGAALASVGELVGDLRETPGVAAVSPPVASSGQDAAIVTVTPTTGPQDDRTEDLLTHLRERVVPDAMAGSGVAVKVGGITAADVDQTSSIAARLPLFITAVIVLGLVLLVAVFRSLTIALQAALSNLLSVGAAYGVIAYAAQGGWFGQLIGITTQTPVPAFIPMMMFAVLFGLSMDYEVFLVSRVREEYLRTRDNGRAVADAVATTGKVITAAALIMTAVFGAFVLDDQIFLKIIGVGMAAAVLVDALVIRLALVPSTMHLLGDRNWWLPAWLDRLVPTLDIEGGRPDTEGQPLPTPVLETS